MTASTSTATLGQRVNALLLWMIAIPVALLVLLFASASLIPAVLGWQSLVVTSASMTPNIPVGSVVVVRRLAPGEVMQVNDVGTFDDPAGQLRVTHRVIEVLKDQNGVTVYRTKGDAVTNPDGELRRPEHTEGKVLYTVPLVGWIPYYLNSADARTPLFLAVLLVLGISVARSFISRQAPVSVAAPETSSAAAAPVSMPATPPREVAPAPVSTMIADQPAPAIASLSWAPASVQWVAGIAALGAAAFAIGLAMVALLPLAWDWHPFTMPDSSMEPAIARGTLVMAETTVVFKLNEGDLVTFTPVRERDKVYIRRVVSKQGDNPGNTVIRTKGDNLPSPDPLTIEGTQKVGKVVYTIPYVGDWLSWAGSRQGFLVFGGLIVALLIGRMVYRARQPETE